MGDDLDTANFVDSPEASEKPKRKGGGGKAILGLLKWIGIGLGAVIFIVVIVVITVGLINRQAKPMTDIPTSADFRGTIPVYATFTGIEQISINTIDREPWAIVVKITLAYDETDKQLADELNQRRYQIQDELRSFFSTRSITQLMPDREGLLKEEIRERLNRLLSKPAIKAIYFQDFRRTQI